VRPRSRRTLVAESIRGPILAACALCAMGGLIAVPSLRAADRIPPWMDPASITDGLQAFPDEDVVQLYRFFGLEVDGTGKRTATLRATFHVRAGDARTCRALRFTESPMDNVRSFKGWRRAPSGKTTIYEKYWTTQAQGGELYSETRTLTLEIAEAGPGDFFGFELRYEKGLAETRTDWIEARGPIPVVRGAYELTIPSGWTAAGWWIEPERERVSHLDPTTQTAGKWTWGWERVPGSGDPEPYEPSNALLVPDLVVTYEDPSEPSAGLRTWRDVSDWFAAFSASALAADPEIDAAATRLCLGARDQHGQIQQITDFVRSSIGYVQIYLADGGWRPHAAGLVYRDRFGDCKDMAHLAIALLRSAGVKAFPVLTNGGWDNVAWPQFPMPAFNHCIVAIQDSSSAPSYLFFDATAKNIPLGRLPASLEGQWSLIVGSDADSMLVRLPRSEAGQNLRRFRASVTLGSDLRATGSVEVLRIGQPAFEAREYLRQNTLDKGRQGWEESFFAHAHVGAKVQEWSCPDVDRVSDTLLVRYAVEIPGLGQKVGDLVMLQPDFLTNRGRQLFPAVKRTRAIAMPYPSRTETVVDLTLPEGWKVSEMPDSVGLENRFGSFSRSCRADGQVIRLRRVEEIRAVALPVEEFPLAGDWDHACFAADRARVVLTTR
jgi:transglutaminase-like putative cysteine protease